MKVKIVAVGKIKESYYREALAEYVKRTGRFSRTEVAETAEYPPSDAGEIPRSVKKEGEELLKHASGYVIALDKGGVQLDSRGFSALLGNLMVEGRSEVSFLIGGSDGLDEGVLRRADKVLSFGKATYPHQLMRVILAEQIYRAFTILNKMPYHK